MALCALPGAALAQSENIIVTATRLAGAEAGSNVSVIDAETIAAGLGRFRDVVGHLERIEMGQPFAVIVDFAHTPVACEAADDRRADTA